MLDFLGWRSLRVHQSSSNILLVPKSFSKKSDKFFHFREEYHACSIVLQLKLACSLYFFFIGFFFNQPAGSDYTHYSEVLKALNCTFSLSRIRIWLILPSTKISKVPSFFPASPIFAKKTISRRK